MLSAAPALAAEGASPVIGHVATTEVAEHEVEVEAQIDPEGLETSYEVRLVWQEADPKGGPTNDGERPAGGEQPQTGSIAVGSGNQTISAKFAGLEWGYTYWYVIAAVNSAGKTKGESPYSFGFHISGEFPDGSGTGPQYESEIPLWYNKLSEEESAKTLKEYEVKHAKELEAQHAKEHEEQEVKEAAARVAEATAREQREEQEQDKGGISLAGTSLTVQSNGEALVKLNCLGIDSCRGKLTLTAKGAVEAKGRTVEARGKKKTCPVAIGTVSFSISGDETKTVKIKLDAAGRALLSADHRGCNASLAILELAPSPENTQTKAVRLVQRTVSKGSGASARAGSMGG